ncbi:MAG: alpha/beta hydrolase [Caulobacter segnis]|uniref:Alpha/beta hydrolase n=1 Tax=Caulobacter segnis TaxID=88688 RepID=A0A2W5WYY3_9CAUL|nr:MAG: alpha/beta hydrolase [Caulobacter segnis]
MAVARPGRSSGDAAIHQGAELSDQPGERADLSHVDPELRAAALQVLSEPSKPITRANLAEIRALWVPPPPLPSPEIRLLKVPGRRGDPEVPVELIGAAATGRPRPAILHIHGGGFISGKARNLTAFCQHLASEFDCVVVNVDYRLAPETPYPGPVEDNYEALAWLHREAPRLGVDPDRIVVMGESAGGGHAAILTLLARDRAEVPLRAQILLYPMLDDRTGATRMPPPHVGTIGWNAAANRFGWESFLGGPAGGARAPAGASPARVADLSRLPPTFIGVGDIDLFVEENFDFARRLVLAGVPTELVVVPGAFHAFDFVAPEARVSRDFTRAWKAALKTAFTA